VSCAIPPQTYLCCPPTSVYSRRHGDCPAQRQTFAALAERGSNLRLVCFTEILGGGNDFAAPVKSEIKLKQAPFSLEAIPTHATSADDIATTNRAHLLLVSYADRKVECVSMEHARLEWTHTGDSSLKRSIDYATTIDTETARKGLLKQRQDVLNSLDTATGNSALLLCRITRSMQRTSL
jgi:hypothetical protein